MLNLPQLVKFFRISLRELLDVLTVFRTGRRSRAALAAENLFLRKQLALYLERSFKSCQTCKAGCILIGS
jgi:hypothetical protein